MQDIQSNLLENENKCSKFCGPARLPRKNDIFFKKTAKPKTKSAQIIFQYKGEFIPDNGNSLLNVVFH